MGVVATRERRNEGKQSYDLLTVVSQPPHQASQYEQSLGAVVQEDSSPHARAEELKQSLEQELLGAQEEAAAAAAEREAAEKAVAELQAEAEELAQQQAAFKVLFRALPVIMPCRSVNQEKPRAHLCFLVAFSAFVLKVYMLLLADAQL